MPKTAHSGESLFAWNSSPPTITAKKNGLFYDEALLIPDSQSFLSVIGHRPVVIATITAF